MADEFTLAFVQGQTLEHPMTWKIGGVAQSLDGWVVHSHLRTKHRPYGTLILDLAEFITVEPLDINDVPQTGLMVLRVSAQVVNDLVGKQFKSAVWDLYLVRADDPTTGFRLGKGPSTFEASSTDIDPLNQHELVTP